MDIRIRKYYSSKIALFPLKLNKFITWTAGIWPLETEKLFTWIRFVLTIISQIYMIVIHIIILIIKCANLKDDMDVIVLTVCSFISMSKCIAIRFYMNDIRIVFYFIFDKWTSIEDEKSVQILKPFIKISNFVAIMQIIQSCTLILMLSIIPIGGFISIFTSNKNSWNSTSEFELRELPMTTACLFGEIEDEVYVFLYIFEVITIFLCSQGIIGCDIFIFNMTMYLCGTIELLKIDIMNIKENVEDPKKLNANITELIERHKRVLEIAEILNKCISITLLIQIPLNAALNLLLGLRLLSAIKLGITALIIRASVAFNLLLIQLYLTSYAGDLLMHHTESIFNSLYFSNWYELPINLQKKIYFMALRANKPVYRIVGGFFAVHLQNFTSIVKSSFSYFSIVRLMFKM